MGNSDFCSSRGAPRTDPLPTPRAWRARLAPGACLFLAALACGSDAGGDAASSGPNGAARQAEVDDLCDTICERDTRCPDEADPDADAAVCRSECAGESPDPELMRGDILRALVKCQSQLACGENDDQCLEQVLQELVPDYNSSTLLKLCLDVQDRCGGFSDDTCSYSVTFTNSGKKQLEDCLNTSCDRVGACMKGLTQQI